MNYLAHAYLSFEHPDILAGNMISDYVKGRQKLAYSLAVQNGIMLHRFIDTFTDCHPATQTAKQYFRPAVGLYAGAFCDVVYDHFLALDDSLHSDSELKDFASRTYHTLESFVPFMPEKFARIFPYMKAQDWLYHYRTLQGIENSFGGLARRAVYLNNSIAAYDAFTTHYSVLKDCYKAFFPDVRQYAYEQWQQLVRSNG